MREFSLAKMARKQMLPLLLMLCMVASVFAGSSFTKTVFAAEKTTTVYYQNSSYQEAYIHYKVGNGNWTSVPGVKMEKSSTQSGYTWKYVINLGSASGATVCFNNGNGSWDSKNGANYEVGEGVFGIKNGVKEELKNEESLDVSVAITGTRGSTTATTTVKNGTAPYTFNYVYTQNGTNAKNGTSTSTTNTNYFTMTTYDGGTYKLDVVVTDAEGKTGTATATKELPPLYIADITASVTSPAKVGTKVTFTADVQSEFYYKFPSYRSWSITKDGKSYAGSYDLSNSITYTFEEAGTYEVTCVAEDSTPQKATKTIQFVVSDANNLATIYYNTSWDKAYIHYCVDGQSWTSVPGVMMTPTTEKSGYNYKAVIDLGTAKSVTACFNNGNGSWDSNNGANYKVEKGNTGIKNGSKVNLDENQKEELDVSVEITGTRGSTTATTTVNNGTAPYTFSYVYTQNGTNAKNGTSTSTTNTNHFTMTTYDGGTYKIDVVVTDAEGNTGTATATKELPPLYIADINASVTSPAKVGTTVTFTADIQSEFYYKFPSYRSWNITKDGKSYASSYNLSNSITYTFEEAGTYEVTCVAEDSTPQKATKTIKYVVSDKTNVATIYYNASWDKAYIHYCVAGESWTAVPGIIMTPTTEKAGYNYKAVIDLGEAKSVTACFNNGNGTWDSKNGANYSINAGTYGVKNGAVSELK